MRDHMTDLDPATGPLVPDVFSVLPAAESRLLTHLISEVGPADQVGQ